MTLRVSVIGTNYLGATTSAGMAEFGHTVIGVEILPERVRTLNAGRAHFYEPGLEPLLERHTGSGRLTFTNDYAQIADWADVHFLCLGTPQGPTGATDLSQLHAAIDTLAPLITRPTLIVGKSTVPVGTADALQSRARRLSPAGDGIEIAWNPEFLREGHAVEDTLRPDRIVFGVQSDEATALLQRTFALPISELIPVLTTDLATAEMIKGAANAFLTTKISFINAMAQLCQVAGGDVSVVADALGFDSRIGREFLNAGLGFGGGCFPKDIRSLAVRADELGVEVLSNLIGAVESINTSQRSLVGEMAATQLDGDVRGKKIAVLGASFKPGTDDTRNSPALSVAATLASHGADVHLFDPQAQVDHDALTQAATIEEAFADSDLVLHLVEWPEFRSLDPVELGSLVHNKIIIDARLRLPQETWESAGWKIVQVGRASTL